MANVQVNQPPDPLNLLGQLFPGFKLNFPSFNPQTIINQATGPIKAVWGEINSPSPSWITIDYNQTFSTNPAVVALQSPNTNTPAHINPPQVPGIIQWENLVWNYVQSGVIPRLPPNAFQIPNAPIVQIGTDVTNYIIANEGIWSALGFIINPLASLLGDMINYAQDIWWIVTGNWGAIYSLIRNDIIGDINTALGNVENVINTNVIGNFNGNIANSFDTVNKQLAPITNSINTAVVALQNGIESAVNSVFTVINDWVGLLPGLSLPVTQVRNITTTSCEIYCPGNYVPVYWLVLGS